MTADRLTEFAQARFGPGVRVEPLCGDASDRRFYRLRSPRISSLILMVHTEPFELESLPWFLHARFLHGIGAAVPQIVASYPDEGILVVQDLGDEMLQTHLKGSDPERRRFLYLQAVQMIVLLQQEGTRAVTPDLPAAFSALDRQRLHYELRFFSQHYVQELLGGPLTSGAMEMLESWFAGLARQVARYPRVLCHRDFHSRNLMVKDDRLYMVDFQDARMGPYTYDLVSLIRDSYVSLPGDLVGEMIQFYREAVPTPEPEDVFRQALTRTALQRNIKAIGTFAYQAVARDNRGYLQYIPPTLDSIRARLGESGEDPLAAEILEMFAGPLGFTGEEAVS